MKKFTKLATVVGVLSLTGCATIVSKSNYPVNISSNPSGASFVIKNRAGEVVTKGITPQIVSLKAGAGYFKGEKYTITFKTKEKKPRQKTIELDTSLDGWYLGGNLLFGGLLGYLVVDPLTGAMYKLPEEAYVDFNGDKNALNIISIETLTEQQKANLQLIQL